MPSFQLNTNLPRSAIPENFVTELSALLSELLGKPEKYICLHINCDQLITFAGTSEPCAQCYLVSIGKIGKEENNTYTVALTKKLTSELKIQPDRLYIAFRDISREDCGWNGKTFAF